MKKMLMLLTAGMLMFAGTTQAAYGTGCMYVIAIGYQYNAAGKTQGICNWVSVSLSNTYNGPLLGVIVLEVDATDNKDVMSNSILANGVKVLEAARENKVGIWLNNASRSAQNSYYIWRAADEANLALFTY
jgi:hypothetical protein